MDNPNRFNISKHLPLISAILVFFGFLKLHIYYNLFGIQINNYLELGEILASFLDDIWTFLILIGIWIGIQVFVIRAMDRIPLDSETKEMIEHEGMVKQENAKFSDLLVIGVLELKKWIIPLITGVVVSIFYFLYYGMGYHSSILFGFMIFFSLSFIVSIIFFIVFPIHDQENDEPDSIGLFIFSMVMALVLVVNVSYSDYYEIQENPKEVILFMEDNSEFRTDQNKLFIGMSNKYFYFFEVKSGKNIIIPVDEVVRHEID